MTKKIVSVRMSDNLYRDMVQVARDYNITVSEAMRLAAIKLATEHRKKSARKFKAEGMKSTLGRR